MIDYEELVAANEEIKTVDIKGKQYATVVERLKAFRRCWPTGYIETCLIGDEDGKCIIKAEVGYYTGIEDADKRVLGTGIAYEVQGSSYINKTSYIENCETSAVGRALGMAGFGIFDAVSTADEVLGAEQARGAEDQGLMTELLKIALAKGYSRNEIREMSKVKDLQDLDTDRLKKAISYFELVEDKSKRGGE